MNTFLSLLKSKSKNFYVFIVSMGLLNGLLNSTFMVIIGRTVSNDNFSVLKDRDAIVFLGLLVICFLINYFFNNYVVRVSISLLYETELNIVKKIKDTSFTNLQFLGNDKLYAIMRSLHVMGDAPIRFISLLNPLLTVVLCVGYVFWLSLLYGLMMLLLIGVLVGSYLWSSKRDARKFSQVQKLEAKYHAYLNDLLHGFKDVKMSSTKSGALYDDFIKRNRSISEHMLTGLKRVSFNTYLSTSYAWYLLLGVILFMVPKFAQTSWSDTSSFIIILIYIIAPVSTIVGIFPFYSQLKAAVDELNSINEKLTAGEFDQPKHVQQSSLPSFSKISFEDVYFEYFDEKQGRTFSLEPINKEFYSGEVVFIIGGNGSGKSTFLYLLAGLCKPTAGTIFYNDQPVADELYIEYRNQVSAVFFDGYIMSTNYENFQLDEKNERLVKYLHLMKLSELIEVRNLYNMKDRLSKGQQKRLALIMALLMDKKILILDEWAAEQDPSFKDYFYRTVIPYLRDEGITIIAITHDDDYFNCADRVIKFTDGKMVYDQYLSEVNAQ